MQSEGKDQYYQAKTFEGKSFTPKTYEAKAYQAREPYRPQAFEARPFAGGKAAEHRTFSAKDFGEGTAYQIPEKSIHFAPTEQISAPQTFDRPAEEAYVPQNNVPRVRSIEGPPDDDIQDRKPFVSHAPERDDKKFAPREKKDDSYNPFLAPLEIMGLDDKSE